MSGSYLIGRNLHWWRKRRYIALPGESYQGQDEDCANGHWRKVGLRWSCFPGGINTLRQISHMRIESYVCSWNRNIAPVRGEYRSRLAWVHAGCLQPKRVMSFVWKRIPIMMRYIQYLVFVLALIKKTRLQECLQIKFSWRRSNTRLYFFSDKCIFF